MCLANNEHQRHLFDATLGATDEGMHRSSFWEQDLRGIEMNVGTAPGDDCGMAAILHTMEARRS